jgi:hypothetical protein
MEYIILSEISEVHLEQRVKDYIKKGWRPQGGVSFGFDNRARFCQAMIKE